MTTKITKQYLIETLMGAVSWVHVEEVEGIDIEKMCDDWNNQCGEDRFQIFECTEEEMENYILSGEMAYFNEVY